MRKTAIVLFVGTFLFLLLRGSSKDFLPLRAGGVSTISKNSPQQNAALQPVLTQEGGKREEVGAAMEASCPEKQLFISGVVFDLNGKPQAGASCSLFPGRSVLEEDAQFPTIKSDPGIVPIATALSDSEGKFQFPAVENFWRLRVEHPGYVPWEEDFLAPGAFRWVRLRTGVHLSVQVRDEKGTGVEGVHLEALHTPYSQPSGLRLHTTTDSSGLARLLAAPGPLNLSAQHPDYRIQVESWNVSSEPSQQQREIVLARGVQIFGKVRLSGDLPPPSGSRVRIEAPSFREGLTEVACLESGEFSTKHLFRRGQTVEVVGLASGFAESRIEVVIPKNIPSAGRHQVDLRIQTGEKLARGQIVDAAGAGMRGVPLFLKAFRVLPAEEKILISKSAGKNNLSDVDKAPIASKNSQWRWVGETNDDGSFLIEGMAPQIPYSLLILPQGFANTQLWIPEGKPGEIWDLGIVRPSPGASISGLVRDGEDRVFPSIEVSTVEIAERKLIVGRSFETKRPATRRGGWSALTNEEGEFRIGPLPTGKYMLSVGEEMFGPYELSESENRGPELLKLSVNPYQEEKPVYRIRGQVYLAADTSLTRLFVNLFRHRGDQGLEYVLGRETKPGGKIELATPLPGPYSLQVIDLEGNYEAAQLFIPAGMEESVELKPQRKPSPPRVLEGEIRGSDGAPLSGIKVSLKFSPEFVPCSCFEQILLSDAAGRFSFGAVIEGPHRLLVSDPKGRFRALDYFPAIPGSPILLQLEK